MPFPSKFSKPHSYHGYGGPNDMCSTRISFNQQAGKRHSAFTLIEVLVATAVLLLLVALLLGLMNHASQVWRDGKRVSNVLTKGRLAMDLLSRDIEQCLYRRDLPVFRNETGASAIRFYTTVSSPGGDRELSLVDYRLDTNTATLIRVAQGFSVTAAPASDIFSPPDYVLPMPVGSTSRIADGILALRVQFISNENILLDEPPNPIDYATEMLWWREMQKLTGIVVSTVIVSDEAADQFPEALITISERLSSSSKPNETFSQQWTKDLIAPETYADLPSVFSQGIRAYERAILFSSITQ